MPLVEFAREHKQQIVCIAGMATIWPSLHNQILYPITFAFHKEGMPSVYAHFLLYSMVMLAGVVAIAVMNEGAIRHVFGSRKTIGGMGVAGAVGIALIVACDFSSMLSSALVAVGIALAATFVPMHFTFWSMQLLNASQKRVAFDLIVSYLAFCLLSALRITLGLHGWPFAIAFPAASAVLAVVALGMPQKSYPLRMAKVSDYPQLRIVPAVLFVYIACISIWLLNPELALSDYPPATRALMYVAVAALMAVLALLYRPKAKFRARATAVSSSLLISFLVVAILISGFGAHAGYELGNFPALAGKISLEMGIWLMMCVHAQTKHLGIVKPAIVFLVFVVGASNVLSVGLLFYTQGFHVDRAELPVLAISVASALLVLLAVNAVLALVLSRKEARAGDAEADADSGAVSPEGGDGGDGTLDDEAVLERMKSAFKLSAREVDTMRLAAKNMSAKDMAASLYVAESTVNSHLKSIYRKTDVHSKKDLIKLVERYRKELP